jgi:hypothetical protein
VNTAIVSARKISLALLVVAVIDQGHLRADYSAAAPDSSGLARLGRDLKRHAAVNASMRRRVRTILQTAMRK